MALNAEQNEAQDKAMNMGGGNSSGGGNGIGGSGNNKDKSGSAVDNVAFMGSMNKSGAKLDTKYTRINGNLWGYVLQLRTQLWINLKSIPSRTQVE